VEVGEDRKLSNLPGEWPFIPVSRNYDERYPKRGSDVPLRMKGLRILL